MEQKLLATETVKTSSAEEVLRLVASLEQASHHVLAAALVETARTKGLALTHPTQVKEFRGSGLEGVVEGKMVRAGSRSLVIGDGNLPLWAQLLVSKYQGQSVLTVYPTVDDILSAVMVMGDAIRKDTPIALVRLRAAGVSRAIMVTGDDHETAANRIQPPARLPECEILALAFHGSSLDGCCHAGRRQGLQET